MTPVLADPKRNTRGVVVLIDGEKFLILLEEMIEQAQLNIWDYEEFHQDNLANIPAMASMDAFLYGVASGKMQQLEYIKQMVETRMDELGE